MESNDRANEGLFMRLLMEHEPALRAYSRSLLPNWSLVDEVIQEASLTLWQKFDQLQDEEGFLPWAKVVVRFKSLSAISNLQRDRLVLSDRVLELLADEADSLEVEEQAANLRALRSCMTDFTPAHQKLLLAPYTKGGEVRQLAEQSGRSANALYKLLGRLRGKLSDCVRRNLANELS